MSRIKTFAASNFRSIIGGKDPFVIIEEFIAQLKFDPDECERERTSDSGRWMLDLDETGRELEVILEGAKKSNECSVYLGVNIISVPIRGSADLLAAALEIADGLVGTKVSLVGHYLVLSAAVAMAGISAEDLVYYYKLIEVQLDWFRDTLIEELNLDGDEIE